MATAVVVVVAVTAAVVDGSHWRKSIARINKCYFVICFIIFGPIII
jgi:hypothetical protein